MNAKKLELINKIEEKMVAAGVDEPKHDEFVYGETFIESLKWLPEENLEKMLECDLSKCEYFEKAYQLFGRRGALRFTPYKVQNGKENPSLCIRRDRFMHMFRGYHFQVSGTVDGLGDCGSGSYRTDFLTRASYDHDILREGLISYMLWWAAMIDSGFAFDNFRSLFDTDKSVLEDFIKASMSYWRYEGNWSWNDIEPYIVFSKGDIDKVKRKMYEVCSDGKTYAYLAIGEKTVQVQLSGNRLLTITIPDLDKGVKYDLEDEDDVDRLEEQTDILKANHYTEMIAVMALALSGIKMTFHNWYRLFGGLETMPHVNAPGVTKVESLNDIYKCEPDMF